MKLFVGFFLVLRLDYLHIFFIFKFFLFVCFLLFLHYLLLLSDD
jgi:hypothetical protein